MKKLAFICLSLISAGLMLRRAGAVEIETNRLSLSARLGFNVSVHFHGLTTLPAPPAPSRTNPRGDSYNYDDGYVLTDISGNAGGQTWYWGYDDSSRQIQNNSILLSRTTLGPDASPSTTLKDDEPYLGVELAYQRLLGTKDKLHYGVELAGNYMSLSESDSHPIAMNATRTSYPFAFTPGTTPPSATSAMPYQGSYQGPGFVISDTPGAPIITNIPGGAVLNGSRHFDADIWGFRLGPYLEYPLDSKFKVGISGGLAGAIVDADVSWTETVSIAGRRSVPVSGGGHNSDMLWGFYVGANAAYRFSERWSAIAGVQYQDAGNYKHSFSGREVDADFGSSVLVTIGVGWNF
jgi:hypothetical protein